MPIRRRPQSRRGRGGPQYSFPSGGGGGGGVIMGPPDPYEMAQFQHELQMERELSHVNLQAQLHQIQLTQGENMRLNRMREAVAHVQNDPTLSPDSRNDIIMQLRTGMSPLQARQHEANLLMAEIQRELAQQRQQEGALQLRSLQDFMAPGNYDPATGTSTINRGTPNEITLYFNGTNWVPAQRAERQEQPPLVPPTMFNTIRNQALTRAEEMLTPPNLPPRPTGTNATPETLATWERELQDARGRHVMNVRQAHGVPGNVATRADVANWLADRLADQQISALQRHANPDVMQAQRVSAAQVDAQYQELSNRLESAPPEQRGPLASQRLALGRLAELLRDRPIRDFTPEQREQLSGIRDIIPADISTRIQIPGVRAQRPTPENVLGGMAATGTDRLSMQPQPPRFMPLVPQEPGAQPPVAPPIQPVMPPADQGGMARPVQPAPWAGEINRGLGMEWLRPPGQEVVPIPQGPLVPQGQPVNMPQGIVGGLGVEAGRPLPEIRLPQEEGAAPDAGEKLRQAMANYGIRSNLSPSDQLVEAIAAANTTGGEEEREALRQAMKPYGYMGVPEEEE